MQRWEKGHSHFIFAKCYLCLVSEKVTESTPLLFFYWPPFTIHASPPPFSFWCFSKMLTECYLFIIWDKRRFLGLSLKFNECFICFQVNCQVCFLSTFSFLNAWQNQRTKAGAPVQSCSWTPELSVKELDIINWLHFIDLFGLEK